MILCENMSDSLSKNIRCCLLFLCQLFKKRGYLNAIGRSKRVKMVYKMDTFFLFLFLFLFLFFASVGLTYEQSAVKFVVRVLKSGTVLYKTYAHGSLLNVTFVCSCLLIYSI